MWLVRVLYNTIYNIPFPQNVEPNGLLRFLPTWDVLWIYDSHLQTLRRADAAAGKVVHVLPLSVRAWWKDQPSPHWLQAGCETQPSTPQHPMYQDGDLGRGGGCNGAERGQAVTSLAALAGSGRVLLTESFSMAEGLAQCGSAIPSMSSKLSFVITAAASPASQLKKKGFFLKFLEQEVLWKLPFSDPTLKTHNVEHNVSEHEWRRKAQSWIKATFGKR